MQNISVKDMGLLSWAEKKAEEVKHLTGKDKD